MTDGQDVEVWCSGRLVVLFADESSMSCSVCDWSGWPRQEVELGTGRILQVMPHRLTWYPHLHNGQQYTLQLD